jgi:uncharacterized protein
MRLVSRNMDILDLADYRRRVAELYLSDADLAEFRRRRGELFRSHPQSPIRGSETGPAYYPENPAARVEAALEPAEGVLEIDSGGEDGVVRYRRIGRVETPFGGLTVFWIAAYGGGLFVPFRDATVAAETYGGGRYLTDTVKGTFGRGLEACASGRVALDFNYAYNPSCAYDARWACPLAPLENRLAAPVRAGELAYGAT